MEEYLRTYCEIDLKAIRQNYINIKKKTRDNAMTMAVIKADGYGHGAVEVAHYLNDIADYFGVATIDEGVELRNAGLKQPILLLGYNSPSLYYKNLEYGVDQMIYCYDMARAGIILYGLYPSDEVDFSNLELTPAMSWYSHVVNIMEPEMERGVSYGATYVVDHPCRLATVSVGYADGYARSLSNKGWVLIHGQKAPIVGRVCMDQMMVDITDITDVKLEDTVTLIGKDGDNYISVEDMANLAGSFNYEFVCDVGKRVPRVYIK